MLRKYTKFHIPSVFKKYHLNKSYTIIPLSILLCIPKKNKHINSCTKLSSFVLSLLIIKKRKKNQKIYPLLFITLLTYLSTCFDNPFSNFFNYTNEILNQTTQSYTISVFIFSISFNLFILSIGNDFKEVIINLMSLIIFLSHRIINRLNISDLPNLSINQMLNKILNNSISYAKNTPKSIISKMKNKKYIETEIVPELDILLRKSDKNYLNPNWWSNQHDKKVLYDTFKIVIFLVIIEQLVFSKKLF